MKRIIVPAAVAATFAAGCAGGGQGQATRPSEGFQGDGASGKQAPFKAHGSSSKQSAGHKAPKDYPVNATAVLSVGSGMTVSLQGGGQAQDLSSGSNCTRDETNTSFTTQGDNQRHGFQVTAKGGGSCSIEPSWSYFKVSVKDSSGKEVGHGESLWLGQTGAGRSYFVACDQAHQGDQPKPWVGLKCSENGDFEVKISRA